MDNWEIVQRNKETGEEKTFLKHPWPTSKETAKKGADIRRMIVSQDKYEVFIRQVPFVT